MYIKNKPHFLIIIGLLGLLLLFCIGQREAECTYKVLTVRGVSTTDLQNNMKSVFNPGDYIRYVVTFDVPLLSWVKVEGTVTFTSATEEILPVQYKWFRAGDYSIFWDSIVPANSLGDAKVIVNYRSIPGRSAAAFADFTIEQSAEPPPGVFVGSVLCLGCHTGFNKDIVDAYLDSGHHFALNTITGSAPVYPEFAPGIPSPPVNFPWADIMYVIGGYGWKANFVNDNGYVLTTGMNSVDSQYNLSNSFLGTDKQFVSYEINQNTPKAFDCGPCHTTGYSSEGNEKELPGLIGTWKEAGVGCEACHGPGSNHVSNPSLVSPPQDLGTSCNSCHIRDDVNMVEAEDGLILHQQQADELNAGGKFYFDCTTCHNAHASTHYDRNAQGSGIIKDCTKCHTDKTVGLGMQSLRCIDCHMPYAVLSAARIRFQDANGLNITLGDMRSHLFTINTEAKNPADMFTADGLSVATDSTGRAKGLTLNFVCQSCHRPGGIAANSYTFEQVKSFAGLIHTN